jgi:acetylcholinesterase
MPRLISRKTQILESGTASSVSNFNASRETPSWMLFVHAIPSCATTSANDTFSCLMSASSSDLAAAISAGLALDINPFHPVLDGPGGIVSDYPAKRLSRGAGGQAPLMLGASLDEGLFYQLDKYQTHVMNRDDFLSASVSGWRHFDMAECKFYTVSTWR